MRNRTLMTSVTLVSLGVAMLTLSWPSTQPRASDQQSNQTTGRAADKPATGTYTRSQHRCRDQCDSENGQCNSEVRRSRQECSKEALQSGPNPFNVRPEAYDYYCGYFDLAQCTTRSCIERHAQRYTECVQFMRGSITARRFDCIRAEKKAQSLCRIELQDCSAQCQ